MNYTIITLSHVMIVAMKTKGQQKKPSTCSIFFKNIVIPETNE